MARASSPSDPRDNLPAAPCIITAEDAKEIRTLIHEIQATQQEIRLAIVGNIDLGQKGLATRVATLEALAARTPCPNPGACVALAQDVAALRKTCETNSISIRQFERVLDQAKGFGMAGRALWAFIGAGGIGAIAIAYQLLANAPGK